jgi:hypothetical protein
MLIAFFLIFNFFIADQAFSHNPEKQEEKSEAIIEQPKSDETANNPCKSIIWYTSIGIPNSGIGVTLAPDSNTGLIRLVDISWIEKGTFWDSPKNFQYFIDENKFYFGKPLIYEPGVACKGTGCNPLYSAKTTNPQGISIAIEKIKSALLSAKYKDDDHKNKVETATKCALSLLESVGK